MVYNSDAYPKKFNYMTYSGYIIICFVLSVFDIVVGLIWDNCYLSDNRINLYLILSGSFLLATTTISIVTIIFTIWKKGYESLGDEKHQNIIQILLALPAAAYISTLIWGMSILWGTHIQNCNENQYNYAYYRTTITMFLMVIISSFYILTKCIGCSVGFIWNII
jgi:hypothetical protein